MTASDIWNFQPWGEQLILIGLDVQKSDGGRNKEKKITYVRSDVFTAVTMKNVIFWDINTKFAPLRRHITSLLQSPAI
jgi:hypothetical protein